MKKYVVFYFEGRSEVCWTTRANSIDEAEAEFKYELAFGRIEKFNQKKGYKISELN